MTVIEQILDLARWAPSGDNTQPWRFEVVSRDHFVIHGFDTRTWCLYDIDGRPSQLALGALLENIDVAARGHSMTASVHRRETGLETRPTFDVRLSQAPNLSPPPLLPFIVKRSVQRRALSMRPLATAAKEELERAVGESHLVRWFEGFARKRTVAMLMFHYSKLRLTSPEAYAVHRAVIAWNSRYSEDKVPDAAIGLDPVTARLMRWVMRDWRRVRFFNRFLAGTFAPRIQLDLLPGIACGAHFLILAKTVPETIDDFVSAGRAMQRFWLTATKVGLQLQPEMTPLIFAAYVRQGRQVSEVPQIWKRAKVLADRFERLAGPEAETAVFMGRVGSGDEPRSRSLRLPVGSLMLASGKPIAREPGS